MDFKRWCSIENHYQTATFNRWITKHPEVNGASYKVTEKIHGANFSILTSPDGTLKFASRNNILEETDKFYGYKEIMSKYQDIIDFLLKESKTMGEELQLYGEVFGGSIQKGVFYGKEKQFRWYSLRVNGTVIAPMESTLKLQEIGEHEAPVIGIFTIKKDLLELIERIDTKFNSKLTPVGYADENLCEGVVIVPYERNFYNQNSLLLIKKKNNEFIDKQRKPKVIKSIPENIQNVFANYSSFVCEVRTNDLFSKVGEFTEMKEISKFAKAYFEDVAVDYEKEFLTEWEELSKADKQAVKKMIGTRIFIELKESLSRA